MIKVFILIAHISAGHGSGTTIIDNLASQEECDRVGSILKEDIHGLLVRVETMCIEVEKAK